MQAAYVDEAKIRAVYDQLEASRIAIFPVDARGLMVTGASPSNTAMWAQHTQMNQVAEATGGHAYYNSNGLDGIAAHVLDQGGNFYTLTYSPRNFKEDDKWHKVEIKLREVSGNYELSYRRGYFADTSGGRNRDRLNAANQKPRRLLSGGMTAGENAQMGDAPIIFQVKLLPAAQITEKSDVVILADAAKAGRGTIAYALRYSLPIDDFAVKTIGGKPQVLLGLALIVFNQSGSVTARVGKKINLEIHPDKLPLKAGMQVSLEERVNLPKGDDSVYCAVWDMTGHRMGTIRVPLAVTK